MDGANNTNNRFLSCPHYILQPAAGPPPPTLPNNYKLMKMGGSNNQFQTPVFDQTKTQEVAGCIYDYNQLLLIDQLPSQYPQPKQNSSAR